MHDQQKAKYLANPHCCPFCGESYQDYYDYRGGDPIRLVYRAFRCPVSDCGRKWTATYTLTDVEEVTE